METKFAPLDYRLNGLRVLVTGASRGLGRSIAVSCAAAGADLAMVARSRHGLSDTEAIVRDRRSDTRFISEAADLTRDGTAEMVARIARDYLGGVDVLINNAARQEPIGKLVDNDPTAWESAIRLNLLVPMRLMRAVLPGMIERRLGRIINIAGGGAASARPAFSAYAGSKSALVRLTETIAEEVRSSNITVNAIAPGALLTDMTHEVIAAGARAGEKEVADANKRLVTGGDSIERVCELVKFLAVDAGHGLTGKLIAAQHDDWESWSEESTQIAPSLYTLRRLDPHTMEQLRQNR